MRDDPPALMDLVDLQPLLSLRRRDAEWLDCADVLATFHRPVAALTPERGRLAASELLIADHHARRWLGPAAAGRTVVTCETGRFGIAGAFERASADPSEWNRVDELVSELLIPATSTAARPCSLGLRIRRTMTAFAAIVPMLTITVAQAAPPPNLPAEPKPATDPVPEPATTEAPMIHDPPPPIVMPPPTRDDSLSLTGRALWDGLADKPVVLVLKDGTEVAGTVVAHSGSQLAVARASDGTVVAVPKADVSGIRVRASAGAVGLATAQPGGGRTENGHKLAAGGGAMIGIGSASALAGTVMLGIYLSYVFISLPLLLPGLAMIGGGIGMLSSAKKKRAAYDKSWGITSGRNRLMPNFAANRNGGQVGLVLRF